MIWGEGDCVYERDGGWEIEREEDLSEEEEDGEYEGFAGIILGLPTLPLHLLLIIGRLTESAEPT